MKRLVFALAMILVAVSFASADVVLVFNSPTGNIGNTQDYGFGSATIHASGFIASGSTGDLFGKADGGDENGVGLNADPSGNHEIWFKSATLGNKPFVQLDLADLLLKGYTNIQFEMGSTTQGETWAVAACSVGGTLCSTGTDVTGSGELAFHLAPSSLNSTNHYLDFSSIAFIDPATGSNSNVLLIALSASTPTPEPSSLLMLGVGMMGLAGAVRRKLNK